MGLEIRCLYGVARVPSHPPQPLPAKVSKRKDLEQIISSTLPGIYIFYVRPERLIGRFPQFALYIGISNERNSQRPLRDRLGDYLPSNLSTIQKRKNVHRMLQIYYNSLWVTYATTSAVSSDLEALEEAVHGYIHPCFGRRDFSNRDKRPTEGMGDNMKQSQWCVPCLRGKVGDWIYYSTLMRAEQLESRVDTSKNIRESDALDDFLQRTLKERYKNISKYLMERDDRFFNSIIIGVFDALPDWVQFDLSPMAQKLDSPQIEAAEDSLGSFDFLWRGKDVCHRRPTPH